MLFILWGVFLISLIMVRARRMDVVTMTVTSTIYSTSTVYSTLTLERITMIDKSTQNLTFTRTVDSRPITSYLNIACAKQTCPVSHITHTVCPSENQVLTATETAKQMPLMPTSVAGDTSAMGRTVTLEGGGKAIVYTITSGTRDKTATA